MSALAASDARERFALNNVVAEYEAFYQYALNKPEPGAVEVSPAVGERA